MEQDEKIFAEMVRRHRDLIWSVCSSYRLSTAWMVEDAFHEVLCDLWRGMGSFDRRSSERTWIFRVATNTMISLTRRMGNRPAPPATELTAVPDRYELPDNYQHLLELIDALPEPDRSIVKAKAQGFGYVEIAKIVGLSVGAVSMRLTRTLRKLRKHYNR